MFSFAEQTLNYISAHFGLYATAKKVCDFFFQQNRFYQTHFGRKNYVNYFTLKDPKIKLAKLKAKIQRKHR